MAFILYLFKFTKWYNSFKITLAHIFFLDFQLNIEKCGHGYNGNSSISYPVPNNFKLVLRSKCSFLILDKD